MVRAPSSITKADAGACHFADEYFPVPNDAPITLETLAPVDDVAAVVVPAAAPPATARRPAAAEVASVSARDKRPRQVAKAVVDAEERRREVNRKNARKTRLRKKFKLESILITHAQLEEENRALREQLAAAGLKPPPRAVTADFFELASEPLFGAAMQTGLILPRDKAMLSALSLGCSNFCLTDPAQADNPIIFVSPGFLEMSGYSKDEVLGRNCRFLQCAETDPGTVKKLRDSIQHSTDVAVTLLNQRKDGSRFWNQLFMAPIMGMDDRVKFFVGVQRPITVVPRGGEPGDGPSDEPSEDE